MVARAVSIESVRPYLTIGVIARRVNQPLHRVEYFLRSNAICPIGRAGNARVFDEGVVAQVRAALTLPDSQRGDEEVPIG
ncbi:MAG: hypothetical protein HND58_09595 [Planctomycetota bacterium]|nr:MAG: hypothetical protein HND58_09595 [Planctomycetota bacterium]